MGQKNARRIGRKIRMGRGTDGRGSVELGTARGLSKATKNVGSHGQKRALASFASQHLGVDGHAGERQETSPEIPGGMRCDVAAGDA